MSSESHRNRLARETSPYLLQHASNPVDWHPWGEEALERARENDRPILLSVGYAACHWCHVMERESFEDPSTAAAMNESFVCIKVDREERPDVDDVYMRAVQMMTGSGGWPLTVFLTPELEPFYGGTYFPPEPRMGMPSFRGVLQGVRDAWENRRDEVVDVGAQLSAQLQARSARSDEPVDRTVIHRAAMGLHERFDPNYGGFGNAPKFPNATSISLLLRHAWRERDPDLRGEAEFTLVQMAAGGIHDHLGGGFHRYAVDARWLVPHFEKMLYDNALLALSYLEAFRMGGEPGHAETVRSIFTWLLREMVTPEGGFASTLDADSEGEEGKFYVWSRAEVEEVLGERAELFCRVYDVTEGGNWEGKNILHLPRPLDRVASEEGLDPEELRERLAADRATLLEARERRVRPALDDKVLADWNGLMISALARGHRALGEERWLVAAERAADFVLGPMRGAHGLRHAWRVGEASVAGFLDDYAAMLQAVLDLYLSRFDPRRIDQARELADAMLERFLHPDGGLYLTGPEHDSLVARPLAAHDGATPSGNGMAAVALDLLARLTGEERYAKAAEAIPRAFAQQVRRHPAGFSTLLLGVDRRLQPGREIVIAGDDDARKAEAAATLWRRYRPDELVLIRPSEPQEGSAAADRCPLLRDKSPLPDADGPTFYLCAGMTCQPPITDLDSLLDDATD